MIICLLTAVAGAFLAFAVPLSHFVVGLLAVTLLSATVALFGPDSLGHVSEWTTLLYVSAQVGYGCGIVGIALLRTGRLGWTRGESRISPVRKPSLK